MATHVVSASARIAAAPDRVYALIADFRNGHPRILPKEFSDPSVEQGGYGAGTITKYRLKILGKSQWFRGAITEPEPGRVLVETILDGNGAVTTFTVNPVPEPGKSDVNISTALPVRGGLLGAIEGFVSDRILRPIYQRELELIAAQLA